MVFMDCSTRGGCELQERVGGMLVGGVGRSTKGEPVVREEAGASRLSDVTASHRLGGRW